MTSKTPITVYLRLPEADLDALTPVIRLVSQTIIHDAITTHDKRKGEGCYPVLLLLDEAGRVKIPDLDEYATTVVGRQISLWVAIQSIKQLEAIYGEANAETLLDNMDTQIFYRQRRTTAKYLEEELGRRSAYSRSRSSREGGYETQQTASKSSLHQCGNKLTVFPHLIPSDSNRVSIEK